MQIKSFGNVDRGCASSARTGYVNVSAISLQRGPVDPKYHAEGVAPPNHSSSQKTRLNDLSYDIKNLDRSFFRFVTNHAFDRRKDRRTDGQTDRQNSHR